MPSLPHSGGRRAAAGLAAGALALTAGCGGGSGDGRSGDDGPTPRTPREAMLQSACRGGTDRTMKLAVAEYVKRATPKPQRFLNAVGTDSALPEVGVQALQDKGPTYLFPGTPSFRPRCAHSCTRRATTPRYSS
jgi:hypothetical protein